ncbi:MAG: GTP cyclohydrolase FolE2 [Armatimonadota bacterium]
MSRLADTQSREDRRMVPLQRVGVKGVELPFLVRSMADGHQTVLARVSLTADLPHYFKGTHMSRFIAILEEWRNRPVSGPEVRAILEQTKEELSSEMAHVEILFKYFIEKSAPVSGLTSVLGYESTFRGSLNGGKFDFQLGVDVPISTVCPCSQEIARIGAHNQRATIRARVRFAPGQVVWIEELVRVLEAQGSVDIYPLLKREDEKYVTERAFENPKFVEDVVRDSVLAFRSDPRLRWFSVECEAEESIHQHSAFAYQEETK